ncbi:MAG TPA: hypothetical protein VI874_02085, partial [Candidatus Norongarragalinales archaeon]|nr:hypothetical protein [Candidatus Norongarragalinales archaeon]
KQREEYTNTEWNARWVNADQLDKNDYLAIPIDRTVGTQEFQSFVVKAYDYRRKEYYTKHIVLDTDADFFRLIGYYLAEGTVTNDHYLNFTFNVN